MCDIVVNLLLNIYIVLRVLMSCCLICEFFTYLYAPNGHINIDNNFTN